MQAAKDQERGRAERQRERDRFERADRREARPAGRMVDKPGVKATLRPYFAL